MSSQIQRLFGILFCAVALQGADVRSQDNQGANLFTFVDENGTVHISDTYSDGRFQRYEPGTFESIALRQKASPHAGIEVPRTHAPQWSFQTQYDDIIQISAQRYNVPFALIKAVIAVESGFNYKAQSRVGAQGLMQLMPGTAKDLRVTNAFDPVQNIDGGTRYLSTLLRIFGDEELALAAYNAGPARVKKYGTIPPFAETQAYVKSVRRLKSAYQATRADRKGHHGG